MNWPLFALVCLLAFTGASRYGSAIGWRVGWAFARLALPGEDAPSTVVLTTAARAYWDELMDRLESLDAELHSIASIKRRCGIGDTGPGEQIRKREAVLRERRLTVWQEAKTLMEQVAA